MATSDVRKELNFCAKTSVPVLGVIENMAGYMCPCCGEVTNVFSKGGGEIMARECAVPFLGSVPLDTEFGSLVESGQMEADTGTEHKRLLVDRYQDCKLSAIFAAFATRILRDTSG